MAEKKKVESKKNGKKGKNTSKKTVVKEVKKEKVTPKKKEKKVEETPKKTWKDIVNSFPFLIGVFICLLLLVGFLGFLIYQKEKEKKESFDSHITIPVIKASSNFEFSVDASLLIHEDNMEYIFKLTNFRKDEKAKVELPYIVAIKNPTNAVISLTKGEEKEDLIVTQEETLLEEVMPFSEEEEAIYYHLKITSYGELKADDFIQIQILS